MHFHPPKSISGDSAGIRLVFRLLVNLLFGMFLKGEALLCPWFRHLQTPVDRPHLQTVETSECLRLKGVFTYV